MPETVQNLVTTIIPVYNRPVMIGKAVESVLTQTHRPIEIIIIDDGSTDDTPEVIDQLAAENHDVIKVIHEKNKGPGPAREAGRLIAQGEFIQYLDSDDWLLPNKFEDQVTVLHSRPDCDIAYGTSMFVDSDGATINPNSRWTGKRFDYLFPALLERRWWYTQTPLFTRKISDAAGAWSKHRPEDWDLEARMGALKAKLVHCGSTVSCQCEHSGEGRVSHKKYSGYVKDEAWFLPRLYDCAIQAGMVPGSSEMKRFSRWAFMRARDLGAMGENIAARRLMALAEESMLRPDWTFRLVKLMANMLGWRFTGRVCKVYLEKIKYLQ